MTVRVRMNRKAVLKALAKRNMSLHRLAIKAGISYSYISNIMCGARFPSPEIRARLQKALQPLTFDDIFIIEEMEEENINGK